AGQYDKCLSLLTALQNEFPDEPEIPRMMETAREFQAEQHRQQGVAEARELLTARRKQERLALLANLQKQLPRDEEVPRLMEEVSRDQINQRRLQGLREARSVLAAGQYDKCLSLLTALQKEFPDEPEIPRLIETARDFQAEQHRQQGVAEAR